MLPANDPISLGVMLTRVGGEVSAIGGRCIEASMHQASPSSHVLQDLRESLEGAISRINAYEQSVAEAEVEIVTPPPVPDDDRAETVAAGVADFMAFRDARENA